MGLGRGPGLPSISPLTQSCRMHRPLVIATAGRLVSTRRPTSIKDSERTSPMDSERTSRMICMDAGNAS